jgi:DNA (cytosine-5)-methyltransferase 1
LTPRECFNFQGFPKSFKLPDQLADSHLYKQAGNSVSVPLITLLAKAIKQVL